MSPSVIVYRFPSNIYSGAGSLEKLSSVIAELGSRRCGVLTILNFSVTETFDFVLEILKNAGSMYDVCCFL